MKVSKICTLTEAWESWFNPAVCLIAVQLILYHWFESNSLRQNLEPQFPSQEPFWTK